MPRATAIPAGGPCDNICRAVRTSPRQSQIHRDSLLIRSKPVSCNSTHEVVFDRIPMALNLDVLNPEQRAAVLAPDGPILILAGAGSGKTRAITYRIAHLLGERNADPREVLAVTFTNKAAAEMRERVAALIEGSAPPWVSTFHSACARILRAEARAVGFEQNFSILDEGDSLGLLRDVIEEAALTDSP